MRALGAMDTANLMAKACTELGFSWKLDQPQQVLPRPLYGGSYGFPVWYCELKLERFDSREEINISQMSIYRWEAHLEPHCQTSNRAWSQIIGVDLLNLVIYITAWPDATLDEMAAFIFNEGGGLFSRQAISKHLKELEITKKKASNETYQAQQPDVQFCVWSFGTVLFLLAFFRCPEGSSLTLTS
jgi:hypothetical protein